MKLGIPYTSTTLSFLHIRARMYRPPRQLVDVRGLNQRTKATDIILNSKVNPLTNEPFRSKYYEILEGRKKLPVFGRLSELEDAVDQNQVVIIEGETGSGKTTQIPQALMLHYLACHPDSSKIVCCTQPRRVAALNVSKRVADEMDVEFGEEVGYTVRFEDYTTERTRLKFMTDGLLQREAMGDPLLTRYSIIILDEAHERTLATDIMMGLIKEILPKRPDLKLVVMSATLDAGRFQKYYNGAPRFSVSGRTYPVEVFFSEQPEKDYMKACQKLILQLHFSEGPGDILLFLTGEKEIIDTCKALEEEALSFPADVSKLLILPLFSALPPHQQQLIFDKTPPKTRKVVIATNIAETSITIDGIVYVIDPGFSKQNVYDPRSRLTSLLVTPISKASARQRAGRAGRTQPGKCFRLYTEDSFNRQLLEQSFPEIMRSDLSSVILTMLKLQISNIVKFDFMDPPAPETMMRALENLNYLGALDDDGQLTQLGEQMAELPLDPQLAKVILSSKNYSCVSEMLTITAMLSIPPFFLRPKEKAEEAEAMQAIFSNQESDHIKLLMVYDAYIQIEEDKRKEWCEEHFIHFRNINNAISVRKQLEDILKRLRIDVEEVLHGDEQELSTSIRKCLCSGFFMQIAYREKSGKYLMVKDNEEVDLHQSTEIRNKPKWVLFHSVKMTTKNYIQTITVIEGEWLIELAPTYYDMSNFTPGGARDELLGIIRRKQMGEQEAHRNGFLNPKRRRI